ncbi:MAG TPA: class IV adenylate cyclase [Candidatus Omnitrophota bacterium]|jgi:predicted adenylyl cyclase CyaB|nr:class IV adenylate cyclase [Candidatus Omnitrophota bacterium]HQB93776.1 class IV adenylate cyclase [Candidatus Omnitrophota bacterium]
MTVYEIEQKYRLKDLAAVRRGLRALGAKKIASGRETNEFFDRNGELRKRKIAMRLRRYDGQSTLTLKGPKLRSRFTKRVELEMPVEHSPLRSILLLSGFRPVMKYTKNRELYGLGKARVTIDRLRGFGCFLEIEGTVSVIARIASALGLGDGDREPRSYLQMMFGWKH